jgi:hypothetical protein
MKTRKKVLTMTAGATIAVLAFAAGSFVIASSSSSSLIQPAYAAKEPTQTFYCFTFNDIYGAGGAWCENSVDRASAKQQCEMNQEAFAQDPTIASISKCKEIRPK